MSVPEKAKKRHVIITGGSRGLGKALVEGLLHAGYAVSTFSRSATAFTESLVSNESFFFQIADLAEPASCSAFLKSAESTFGFPYALINCAAIAVENLLATLPDATLQKLLAVNGEGTIRFTKMVIRRFMLAKSGGAILNVSSISSMRGFRGLAAYAFTKGGLDAFTRALARELGAQGIRVNSIAPGYYATEMSRSLTEEQKSQILRRTPLGRLGSPADVVGPALFLISDQANFVTGQVLVVDGGSSI